MMDEEKSPTLSSDEGEQNRQTPSRFADVLFRKIFKLQGTKEVVIYQGKNLKNNIYLKHFVGIC